MPSSRPRVRTGSGLRRTSGRAGLWCRAESPAAGPYPGCRQHRAHQRHRHMYALTSGWNGMDERLIALIERAGPLVVRGDVVAVEIVQDALLPPRPDVVARPPHVGQLRAPAALPGRPALHAVEDRAAGPARAPSTACSIRRQCGEVGAVGHSLVQGARHGGVARAGRGAGVEPA